jgi:hypothetical protein
MKKIYLSLAGIAFCGAMFGQSPAPQVKKFRGESSDLKLNRTRAPHADSRGVVSQPFNGWFDPVADPAYNRDLKFPSTSNPNPNIIYYTNVIFPDSTVVTSDEKGKYPNFLHALGSILDPTSSYLYSDANGNPSAGSEGPVVTVNDSYNLDSVAIDAWYVKKKANVTDTLYLWVSWQKPATNDVFFKTKTGNLWLPPADSWRDSILSIQIDTLKFPQGTGNAIVPKAASSNITLIKYPLSNDDTATIGPDGRYGKRIYIKIDPIITIPAGNVTAAYFEFIPAAGSVSPGDCVYEYGASPVMPQNANGIGIKWWAQTDKDTAYYDYLVDPSSKSSSALTFYNFDRYPKGTQKKFFIRGDFYNAPSFNFHIYGISTVGITELSANGNFSLSQNVPNPLTNQTSISYQLKENAKSVSLVIYDIMGAKVYDEQKSNLSAGKYTVNVDASSFNSGIYFYSLIVDGSKVTKKMVISE